MTRTTRKEFTARTKQAAFIAANGRCENCGAKILPANPAEYDHDKPCCEGGDNSVESCRVLGTKCCTAHRDKSAGETRRTARADAGHRNWIGAKSKPKGNAIIPGSKASKWKKLMSGEVVRR